MESTPPHLRSWPRRLLNRMEVDRAVFFAVLIRLWQLLGGAVTVLLMAAHFTPQVQGYYYTFASLIALQTFFELGLNIVIVNVCSHEWTGLELDGRGRIQGNVDARSRLISLGRGLFRWYGVAAGLFVLVVGFVGAGLLARQPAGGVSWQPAWTALVILSGCLLWTLPFNAMLEGCHQVVQINIFRFVQAVLASLVVWSMMVLGFGLWAAVGATAMRLLCDVYLLLVHYRAFFRPFLRRARGAGVAWREEIWPLQWRLAVGGVFSYFAYFLFTPVMYEYHGQVAAGRMGMTWTVVSAIQAAAAAWVQTRVPRFGTLIQQRAFDELDRVFFRVAAFSLLAMAAGATAWVSLLVALRLGSHGLADRVLDLPANVYLLAGAAVQLLGNLLVFYVRAHKREPFLWISVVSNLSVGLAVWWFGWHYGPTGAALGYLAVHTGVTVPAQWMVWRQCRRSHRFAGGA